MDLCARVRHPVRLGDALLLDQCVVEYIIQHAVAVQPAKLVMHKRRRLLRAGHVLWTFWRKFNRLGRAEKYAHQ